MRISVRRLGAALIVLFAMTAPAGAASDEAEQAVRDWLAALTSGDGARIEAILAPEFQIQRGDGKGYDKQAYLASGLPSLAAVPAFTGAVATVGGDVMVVRYTLTLPAGSTFGSETLAPTAPRLTVFRRLDGKWRVAAHANFAPDAR